METPSSTRRVTRSQTAASAGNTKNNPNPNPNPAFKKWDDLDEAGSKQRQSGGNGGTQQQEVRSALLDITNDSPIVGLASGSLKTPLSSVIKKKGEVGRVKFTPGSGEALLRSQVKNLLQKVEERVEITKGPLFRLQGLVNGSPSGFFAPTPANTPQVSDELSGSDHPIVSQEELISKVLNDIFEGTEEEGEDSVESQISLVTRSLLSEFSEKSEVSHDPQVTASTLDAEEEEVEDEEEGEDDDGFLDELCKGMESMLVARFEGKHTRFVYDSDDELVAEEGVLRLEGIPTPRGKHTRFSDE